VNEERVKELMREKEKNQQTNNSKKKNRLEEEF
jgi:hypothetical protein